MVSVKSSINIADMWLKDPAVAVRWQLISCISPCTSK